MITGSMNTLGGGDFFYQTFISKIVIDRMDQWVAPAGLLSSVVVMTAATFSSAMIRGQPERGWSSKPSIRFFAKRSHHLPTVLT